MKPTTIPALQGHASESFMARNPALFGPVKVTFAKNMAAKVMTPKGPNKTELAYAREWLSVGGEILAHYEGITFRLPGGSRYTPDWYLFDGGNHTVVEVKGTFRFGSQGRAWTAFREARAAFPGFRWVWVERQKDGTWKEKE